MGESEPQSARASKGFGAHLGKLRGLRPNGHSGFHHVKKRICEFGVAVQALAHYHHKKAAAWLAHLVGSSERGAQHIIDGDRKVTAKAMHAVEGDELRDQ